MTAGAISVTPEAGNKSAEPEGSSSLIAVLGHVGQFVAGERRHIRPPVKSTPFVVGAPAGFVTRKGSQRQ